VIIYNVVTGERPDRPPGPDEWLSDDIWNFISRCWSSSWDSRPDVGLATNVLNDAADVVNIRRRKSHATAGDPGGRTSRRVSGACTDIHHEQRLIVGVDRLADSRSTDASSRRYAGPTGPSTLPTNFEASYDTVSFCYNTCRLEGDGEGTKEYVPFAGASIGTNPAPVGAQSRVFRAWHDSTGFHRQEAAFVDYNTGVVHLSSSDGTPLEIQEDKLSTEDLNYIRSLDMHKRAQWKVIAGT